MARIGEELLRAGDHRPARELRREAAREHREALYTSVDGRGLREAAGSPPTQSWVQDGTRLMPGHAYVGSVKTRLGLVNTRLRAARGRPSASVLCDLGCGRTESLGHILQMCPSLAPERTRRHDHLLALLTSLLDKRGHTVWREPTIRTSAGARKPDLVVGGDGWSVVLDVQVVSDSGAGDCLARAHALKISYYDRDEISAWVRERSGHSPSYETLTVNWRGVMAPASYSALRRLGLSRSECKLLVVRAIEGSWTMVRAHRDIGGTGLDPVLWG